MKHENGDPNNPANEDMSLTRRVIDVMMMKKTNLESSVEHYKNEGIKLEGIHLQIFTVYLVATAQEKV